jgi:hypothetical protein
MTPAELLSAISSIGALVISGVAVFITWRKIRPEISNLEAESGANLGESAKSFSEAAANYAAQVLDLQNQLKQAREEYQRAMRKNDEDFKNLCHEYDERISLMEKEQKDTRQEVMSLQAQNRTLVDWADRLCHQLKAKGEIPVPMELFPRTPTEQ